MSNIRIRQNPRFNFRPIETNQHLAKVLRRLQHLVQLKCIVHLAIILQWIYNQYAPLKSNTDFMMTDETFKGQSVVFVVRFMKLMGFFVGQFEVGGEILVDFVLHHIVDFHRFGIETVI